MRKCFFAIGIGVLLLSGAMLAWLTLRSYGGPFALEGRVAGFGGERTVYVEHGEVAGRLPARTTPLEAEDPAQLDSLGIGDAVRFTVADGSGRRFRITGVKRLPDNALARSPASKTDTPPASKTSKKEASLQVGERVPNLKLTNQDGETVHLSGYRGRMLVLTFIYTSCPLPNFCPLMSQQFATLQPRLKKRYGQKVQLLSISFDPENDTPQVLSGYAKKHTSDLSTWTFATPETPAKLEKAKRRFGITAIEKQGQIVHNLVTALIDPNGRLVWKWRGNDWKPEDILRVAEQTLEGQTGQINKQAAASSQ